jgi:uncharacterized protein
MNAVVAFLTGLTAGGVGCLALQSGLLFTALGHQFELDRHGSGNGKKIRHHFVLSLLMFLSAKLAAYTMFGFLLGIFGSLIMPTSAARAFAMIVIGIFMLGNGLRMLGVHPIFRHFVLEPPDFLGRFLRQTSKNASSWMTPMVLGALTVFLPCGIAHSMMAAAIGTGDPGQGASLLFAFTLGTMPIFFALAIFAAHLGAMVERNLLRCAAVILIVCGLVSIDSGLTLAGSPLSFTRAFDRLSTTSNAANSGTAATDYGDTILVGDNGYTPKVLHLAADHPVTIIWKTQGTNSCALSVVVPDLKYEQTLPSTGQLPLAIPAQKRGTTMEYSCAMGM